MVKIPKKVLDRFSERLKQFQTVAASHRQRDVSEADTVTLVKDILADTFGYDKYLELTSEYQIRGTYCDLAVKIDGKIKYLVEVKAAAIDLNDGHLRQAIGYATSEGIEWVVLTNAVEWQLHRLKFGQPVETELVASFNLINVNLKNDDDLQKLYLWCREGVASAAMDVYHQRTQLLNRYTVAIVMQSEPVIAIARRERRRIFPEIKIEPEMIAELLINEVLKREVLEGEKVKEAHTRINKAQKALERASQKSSSSDSKSTPAPVDPQQA